jgi:hypothetical protein
LGVESIGFGADQWFGSRADPDAIIVTMAGAYLFAGLTVVNAVAVTLLLRRSAGHGRPLDPPVRTAHRDLAHCRTGSLGWLSATAAEVAIKRVIEGHNRSTTAMGDPDPPHLGFR